jgi:hypothetical protein
VTVERAQLVEFWPLADVGRIGLKPGDTVIIRATAALPAETRGRLREAWQAAFPGVKVIVANGPLEFVVWQPMPELRAEDLVQPVRPTTMD